MPCPLLVKIALLCQPLDGDLPAVRAEHSGHDVIILNTLVPVWQRLDALDSLLLPGDKYLLTTDEHCTCTAAELAQTG